MSKSVVARLRERMAYREAHDMTPETPVGHDELSSLLNIAEAMAAVEPVDWHGERACLYCRVNIGDGDDHEPNCPHIRARELCGMERSDEE